MTESESALFLVVTIRPRRDRLAEVEAQLQRMRAAALAEEGCVFMHLVQQIDGEPATWTMIEHFTSRAAWDTHMASEHNTRGNAELEPSCASPRSFGCTWRAWGPNPLHCPG